MLFSDVRSMAAKTRWSDRLLRFYTGQADITATQPKARGLILSCLFLGPWWFVFSIQFKGFGVGPSTWLLLIAIGVAILSLPFLYRLAASTRIIANLYASLACFTLLFLPYLDRGLVNQALLSLPFVPILAIAFA